MSAAEVLAQHQWDMGEWCTCLCGAKWTRNGLDAWMAAHQLDALKAVGFVVIEIPAVAFKGPNDTDAMFFRQVADRMETPSRVDFLSGSNVRDAVRALLYRAADAAETAS